MSEEIEREFQAADIILADALTAFQEQGVSQYVYAMALLEIGVAALVKLEEEDDEILGQVRQFVEKARGFQGSAFPVPRQ